MNAPLTKLTPESEVGSAEPLAKLREPFASHHISKLPKPTKAQTDAIKADFKNGIRCKQCGAWHHPDVVHLDYVGHAALTDRLLDTDLHWYWEPVAFGPDGLPVFDKTGGLWIKLTVCGVTRLGYGNADPKPNQDAGAREKEVIGDALRNAAMRFGAALDLWHKGDLHPDGPAEGDQEQKRQTAPASPQEDGLYIACKAAIDLGQTKADLKRWADDNADALDRIKAEKPAVYDAILAYWKARVRAAPAEAPKPPQTDDFGIGDDEIPF